jgi:hypothetical protein
MTIGDIADKFAAQDNKPLDKDDCELYKLFLEDDYELVKKDTGKHFKFFDRVIFSIDMLQYDDGVGMKAPYKDAVLSLGTFMKWCRDAYEN